MKTKGIVLTSLGIITAGIITYVVIKKRMNEKAYDYLPDPQSGTTTGGTSPTETLKPDKYQLIKNMLNDSSSMSALMTKVDSLYKNGTITMAERELYEDFGKYKFEYETILPGVKLALRNRYIQVSKAYGVS